MKLNYKLLRSKRKTTALFVLLDGSLLVRAPLRANKKLIDRFVSAKNEWIEKQRAKLTVPASKVNLLDIEQTKKVVYMGEDYPLDIVEHASKPLVFNGKKFILARTDPTRSASLVEKWYRQQAHKILKERVSWFANKYQLTPKKFRISSARTRWGSCSSHGTVSFTWRLMMVPPEVIDYVVVHELVHLIENNHQKPFWSEVAKILPDYKERRSWLKKNGGELMNHTRILET